MGRERKKHSDENESDSSSSSSDNSSLSSGVSVSSDSTRRRRKRRRRESDSETDCSSSEDDDSSRKRRKRRSKHRRDKERSGRKKKHDHHHESKRKKKRARRHHHHHHDDEQEDDSSKGGQGSKLQVTMEAREQEKNLIYQNAELAKARLNGELREVQAQQAKLQDMYGTIDWRARKKLRIEKKKLERSVAAGKKLAQIEEEESARMDAFRIALGLPTAEAQRQAEWRAQATRALSSQEPATRSPSKPPKKNIIGPQLPR